MIKRTLSVDYKIKDVHFEDGVLVDENGVLINIVDELQAVFANKNFELTAKYKDVSEHEVADFA